MSLFWQEMRKIWRPGILAALAVLGALYYMLRLSFFVEQFDGGRWLWNEQAAQYQLHLALIDRFGPILEFEDIPALERQLTDEKYRFEQLVENIPEAAAAGLTTYDAVYTIYSHGAEAANQLTAPGVVLTEEEAYEILNDVRKNTNYSEIYALDYFLSRTSIYTDDAFALSDSPHHKDDTLQVQARLAELDRQRALGINLLGEFPRQYTLDYIKFAAVWVVLSVILLLSPTLVRDRLRRTRAMQWASRRGRRVLGVQMAAGLVSAAALSALDLILLAVPLAVKGAGNFLDCPFFTRERSPFPWFDWTYGQYLLAAAGMLAALGVTAGALALFLSQYSSNYVPMLLKAVPLFVAVGVLFGYTLTEEMFCFFRSNGLFKSAPPAFEIPIFATALALGLGLCAWTCVRQKGREL